MSGPLHLRIFISSPGDVQDERQTIARADQGRAALRPVPARQRHLGRAGLGRSGRRWPCCAGEAAQASVDRGLASPPAATSPSSVLLPSRHPAGRPSAEADGPPCSRGPNGSSWNALDAQKQVLVCRGPPSARSDYSDTTKRASSANRKLVAGFLRRSIPAQDLRKYAIPGSYGAAALENELKRICARAPRRPAAPRSRRPPPRRRPGRARPIPACAPSPRRGRRSSSAASREIDELLARARPVPAVSSPSSAIRAPANPPWSAPVCCRACARRPTPRDWLFASCARPPTRATTRSSPWPPRCATRCLRPCRPARAAKDPRAGETTRAAAAVAGNSRLRPGTAELLLLLDQFEELFRLDRRAVHRAAPPRRPPAPAAPPRHHAGRLLPQALRHDTLAALLSEGSFPSAPDDAGPDRHDSRPGGRAGAAA